MKNLACLCILVFAFKLINAQLPVKLEHPRILMDSLTKVNLLAKKNSNDADWLAMKAQADALSTWVVQTFNTTNATTWYGNGNIFYNYQGESWLEATYPLAMTHQMMKGFTNVSFPSVYSNKLIQLGDTIVAAHQRFLAGAPLSHNVIDYYNSYYASRTVPGTLAIIYDYCYDELSTAKRSAYISTMNDWFADIKTNGYQRNGPPTGNYYWGHAFGIGYMGIATANENLQAQAMIDYARMRLDNTPSNLVPNAQKPEASLKDAFENNIKPAGSGGWMQKTYYGTPFKGGFHLQGWGYGAESFNRVIDYLITIKTATTENLFTTTQPWWQQNILALYHQMLPNRYEVDHVGDWGGIYNNIFPLGFPGRLAYAYANTTLGGNAYDLAFNRRVVFPIWGQDRGDFSLWEKFYFKKTQPAIPIVAPPYYSGFTDSYNQLFETHNHNKAYQYFVMRNNWADTATWIAFNAEAQWYDDHQHFACASFELKQGDKYLLVDANSLPQDPQFNYTTNGTNYAAHSGATNTLFFNDHGDFFDQNNYCSQGQQFYYGQDKTVCNEQNMAYSFFRVDATNAYNYSGDTTTLANNKLRHYYRNFLYLRDANIIAVYDQIRAKSRPAGLPYVKHLRWHTINQPVINGKSVSMTHGTSKLYLHTVFPSNAQITAVNQTNNPDNVFGPWANYIFNTPTWRIETGNPTNPLSMSIISVLQPGYANMQEMNTTYLVTNQNNMAGSIIDIPGGTQQVVLFNINTEIIQQSVLFCSYSFSGSCSALHTLTGLKPDANYTVAYNGNTVTVTQVNGGAYTSSLTGVLQFNVCLPLPLQLIYFDGITQPHGNKLNWKLSLDGEGESVILETTSAANENFIPLKTYTVSGTQQSFEYIDPTNNKAINYYRLRLINKEGTHSFSKTIALQNNKAGSNAILSSDADGNWVIAIIDSENQPYVAEVIDNKGILIKTMPLKITEASSSFKIDNSDLAMGIYSIRIINRITMEAKVLRAACPK